MPVLNDYTCLAHGELGEMFEPKCPHGCARSFVKVIFKKPPSIKHNSTKVADMALRDLATDFGMTDLKNDKYGGSIMDQLRNPQKAEDFAPRWHDVPHAQPGFSRGEGASIPTVDPSAAIGGSTVQGENAPARLFGMGAEGRVSGIPKPRPLIDPKLVYRPSEMPGAPE
jgi:hypothetical protein